MAAIGASGLEGEGRGHGGDGEGMGDWVGEGGRGGYEGDGGGNRGMGGGKSRAEGGRWKWNRGERGRWRGEEVRWRTNGGSKRRMEKFRGGGECKRQSEVVPTMLMMMMVGILFTCDDDARLL